MDKINSKDYIDLIKEQPNVLAFIDIQDDDIVLEALKNGCSLKHIRVQTREMCLESVKANDLNFRYVNDEFKDREICLIAVSKGCYNFGYIPEDNEFKYDDEILFEAVKDTNLLSKIEKQTPELILHTFVNLKYWDRNQYSVFQNIKLKSNAEKLKLVQLLNSNITTKKYAQEYLSYTSIY